MSSGNRIFRPASDGPYKMACPAMIPARTIINLPSLRLVKPLGPRTASSFMKVHFIAA
jgi:hypothetical protein